MVTASTPCRANNSCAAALIWLLVSGGAARDAGGRPAGLTLSSTVLVDGDPGRVLGVLDEESALWDALRGGDGRFAVAPLRESDGQLADIFAGLMPSPGGPFVAHTGVGFDAEHQPATGGSPPLQRVEHE